MPLFIGFATCQEAAMALDASQLLGSPQLAGVKVSPRGLTKSTALGSAGLGVGGLLGGAISATAGAKAGRRQAETGSDTPKFGRVAYLAVTQEELALIKLTGLATFKLDEVIARVPRSDVASAEIGRSLAPSLTITFGSGGSWQLEVARVSKKDAEAVVHALGG
jgi:hypothetical protein